MIFTSQFATHWALTEPWCWECKHRNGWTGMDWCSTEINNSIISLAWSSVGKEMGSSAPRPFSAILSLTASLLLEVKKASAGWTRSLMKNLVLAPRWVWALWVTTDISFITLVWGEKYYKHYKHYNVTNIINVTNITNPPPVLLSYRVYHIQGTNMTPLQQYNNTELSKNVTGREWTGQWTGWGKLNSKWFPSLFACSVSDDGNYLHKIKLRWNIFPGMFD